MSNRDKQTPQRDKAPVELNDPELDKAVGGRKAGGEQQEYGSPPPPPPPPPPPKAGF